MLEEDDLSPDDKDYNKLQLFVSVLKKNFDLEIPPRQSHNPKNVAISILSERDISKRNSAIKLLLKWPMPSLINAVWCNIPTDDKSYLSDGALKQFIEKKAEILTECCSVGVNATPDIEFEGGIITPMTKSHSQSLLSVLKFERGTPNDWYDYEIESFEMGMENYPERWIPEDFPKSLGFSIISPKNELMGCISLDQISTIGPLSTEDTYNLSYFTIPEYRNKGIMKAALKAFEKKLSDYEIYAYQHNGKLTWPKNDYFAEKSPLIVRILMATADLENIASIKLIESLNFEKSGTIKWARKTRADEDEKIDIATSAYYTKEIL